MVISGFFDESPYTSPGTHLQSEREGIEMRTSKIMDDLSVREMPISGLDFKNPVGSETFNCFKKVCVIKRNTNESSISDTTPREVQSTGVKKLIKSSHKVQQLENESSGSETEITAHAMSGPAPKPWNPPLGLKFPCPLTNPKHKVSTCPEFLISALPILVFKFNRFI